MSDRHADVLYRRLLDGHQLTDVERRHVASCASCQRSVTDAEQLEARMHGAARSFAAEPLPVGILVNEESSGPRLARVTIPAMAAVVVAAIAFGLTLSSLVNPTGSATPSPDPSDAIASPIPTEPSSSPGPMEPGNLVEGPSSCGDGTGGFIVWIPIGWYANAAHDEIPGCRLVSTEPFEVISLENPPTVPIRLTVETGDLITRGEVVERTELTLAGLPALRLVVDEENGSRLVYVVGLDGSLPSEGNPDRFLLATTMYGDSSFERDSAALDEMLGRFLGQEPFTHNPVASSEADRLFSETKTCTNAEAQFQVAFPATWFTNEVTAELPACTWFGTTELSAAEPTQPPEHAVIGFRIFSGALASVEPGFAYENLNVGGRPAERTERYGGTPPEPDFSFRTYQYLIQFGEFLSGPNLVAWTDTTMAPDYDLAKAVLDRIMASLRYDGS